MFWLTMVEIIVYLVNDTCTILYLGKNSFMFYFASRDLNDQSTLVCLQLIILIKNIKVLFNVDLQVDQHAMG